MSVGTAAALWDTPQQTKVGLRNAASVQISNTQVQIGNNLGKQRGKNLGKK
jgi:hypothetical protein